MTTDGIDFKQFHESFFDEADENLQMMESCLLDLDIKNPDKDAIAAIFRAAHSLKGGAATLGAFELLVQTTHKLENILDEIRNDRLPLTQLAVDVFLRARDVLNDQVTAYRNDEAPDEQAAKDLLQDLEAIGGESSEPQVKPASREPEHDIVMPAEDNQSAQAPAPAESQAGVHREMRVRLINVNANDLAALETELTIVGKIVKKEPGEKETVFTISTDVDSEHLTAICCFVVHSEQVRIEAIAKATAEQEKEVSVATIAPKAQEAAAKPAAKGQVKDTGTIRVPTQRVDMLVNQVGEVVINQAILLQACQKLDPIEHAGLLQDIEHMAGALRTLQESVMALRMVPMDYAFGRFPRVVRETAAKLGKTIELKTIGGATELDKGLIEKMIDPLTHLVRNSLDHGIEKPEVRAAKGKNPAGLITMAAYHEGGRIVIEVADDGGGLNRDKIISKAMERGLAASPQMSDNDAFQLIFMPGFSTADVITDVSGRGVGMDVVRRNIQEVGGQIQIESKPDQGTTLRISLPLTLAIMDGMSIQVGNERYVMPLNHIKECLQPTEDQIKLVNGGQPLLALRGEHLPILRLCDLFDVSDAISDLTKSILIVVQAGQNRYALGVDQLLGQHQVVVKSLETHYERVPGISGATILGDGSVALILDAATLYSNE